MNNDPNLQAPAAPKRALVLGGGGSAGNAWSIGVIAGLADGGLDVTKADVIIGTSSGSTTAAQITSASPTQLFAATTASSLQQRTGPVGSGGGRVPVGQGSDHIQRMKDIIAASSDLADMRRRIGAAALNNMAALDGSWQAQWHDTVAARLPSEQWPQQLVHITAVEAHTGEPVVFDRNSGVNLVDAVAASCAGGGMVYAIAGRQYIDGGYRLSSENADLAAGYSRVVVLSPLGGKSFHPPQWGSSLAVQVDELRIGGSNVETILPDDSSRDVFGDNMMDPSRRAPAAQAGYKQGQALVDQLAEFWR